MWDNLQRVDWGLMHHAYGPATDVPSTLQMIISDDKQERDRGWDTMWGAINHQGDFYDSTVAAICFLVEAVAYAKVPEREKILRYFRSRWDDASAYGGDPGFESPPGGVDEPTPRLATGAVPGVPLQDEDHDTARTKYRRMDLAAWQCARAIAAGRPTYRQLLSGTDRRVAAAAAELLLVWREDRRDAKQLLARLSDKGDPVDRVRCILESAVYGDSGDKPMLLQWTQPDEHAAVRFAAALALAWIVAPDSLDAQTLKAMEDTARSPALRLVPWVGIYSRGPWIMPGNAAQAILWMTENTEADLRWRAVQGLETGRGTPGQLPADAILSVLKKSLDDSSPRVRTAAATALAQRAEAAYQLSGMVEALRQAVGADDPSVSASAAYALAAMSGLITDTQRANLVPIVDSAIARFQSSQATVFHGNVGRRPGVLLSEARNRLSGRHRPGAADYFSMLFEASINRGLRTPIGDHEGWLAAAYEADRPVFFRALRTSLKSDLRSERLGAALWLARIGPAAADLLRELELAADLPLAGKPTDTYLKQLVARLTELIKRATSFPAMGPDGRDSLAEEQLVGVAERVSIDGRAYFWRIERVSRQLRGLNASLRENIFDEATLGAMLEQSVKLHVIYGIEAPMPVLFSIRAWKGAAYAYGGVEAAEQALLRVKQACTERARNRDERELMGSVVRELETVLNHFSGKIYFGRRG
jgi:hypothetical protein